MTEINNQTIFSSYYLIIFVKIAFHNKRGVTGCHGNIDVRLNKASVQRQSSTLTACFCPKVKVCFKEVSAVMLCDRNYF